MGWGWIKAAAASAMLIARIACAQTCTPTFGTTFNSGELNGPVNAIVVAELGDGPAAYLGGEFTFAGETTARRVVKWTGTNWSALGEGFDAPVHALAVAVMGSQLRLFAGGDFTSSGSTSVSHIAMWNGSVWVALSAGLDGPVNALLSHDDGSGPALYVGGQFPPPAGGTASNLARWRPSGWSSIGGANGPVMALAEHNQGSGPALYVGGGFSSIGGTPANQVARWSGAGWSALGSGVDNSVHTLASHNDGSGSALYAGGAFTSAGGNAAVGIARWNGQAWSAVASLGGTGANHHVDALTVYEGALWAGGKFTAFGGTSAPYLAKWNGSAWSGSIGSSGPVRALSPWIFAGLPPDILLVGGQIAQPWPSRFAFSILGNSRFRIAEASTGTPWYGSYGELRALAKFDDGSGPALFAGGWQDGQFPDRSVFKWTGSAWVPVGDLEGSALDLLVFDDGSGPALYASGYVTKTGSPIRGMARWNGLAWSPVGEPWPVDQPPRCMATFDEDGNGPGHPALFAGGYLHGTTIAWGVSRWDGTAWSTVGGTMNDMVYSLAAHDDGSGPALYAAGIFNQAGGVPSGSVVRWTGAAWSPVGAGLNLFGYPDFGTVYSLHSFDGGSAGQGAGLYAGGVRLRNPSAPSEPISIARWHGQQWSAVGTGLPTAPGAFNAGAFCMSEFDEGTGRGLFVGRGGSDPIVKLTTSGWSPVFPPMTMNGYGATYALFPYDLGRGPSLIAAGRIGSVGLPDGIYTDNIVELRGCACYANCDGSSTPPVLNVTDFICFMNRYAAADPWANCDGSTIQPVLNVLDFVCFGNTFGAGCP